MQSYPHPPLDTSSLVGNVLGPFLFAANMFGFIVTVCRCTSRLQSTSGLMQRIAGGSTWGFWTEYVSSEREPACLHVAMWDGALSWPWALQWAGVPSLLLASWHQGQHNNACHHCYSCTCSEPLPEAADRSWHGCQVSHGCYRQMAVSGGDSAQHESSWRHG